MNSARVPVTLLGGMSSGLREQVAVAAVRERARACAVVYDVEAALAGLVLLRRVLDGRGQHAAEPVELVGCCLACTVRADLAPALDSVSAAGRWDEVLVSLPTAVTPSGVAAGLQGHGAAEVDTVSAVVDAVLLVSHLQGDDLLADRGRQAAPTDRRSTADLLVSHLEDADVLLVAGLHRLAPPAAAHVQALLSHLAPLALPLALAPDGHGAGRAVSTGRSRPSSPGEVGAPHRTRAAEREHLAVLAAELCAPACDVTTTTWSVDRPFHPRRLAAALEGLLTGVVRSRGWISLAGRPDQLVRWESVGPGLSLGDPVLTDLPPHCRLVLTATGVDPAALREALAACLVEPGYAAGCSSDDPFRDVLGPTGRP